jgi:hypothetical protein
VHEIDENGYIALLIIGADTELARKYIHTVSLKPGFTSTAGQCRTAAAACTSTAVPARRTGRLAATASVVYTEDVPMVYTRDDGAVERLTVRVEHRLRQGPLKGSFRSHWQPQLSLALSSSRPPLPFLASLPPPARPVRLYCRLCCLPHRLPRALRPMHSSRSPADGTRQR